jgi:hypothetical protein
VSVAEDRPPVERVRPPSALIRFGNPVMRRLLGSRFHGAVSRALLLLHYTGRMSGRRYDVPVGYHDIGGTTCLLTNSGWRVNFRGGRDAEVTLRGRRRPVHATLVEDPETVARVYRDLIAELGPQAAQRRLGLRINVDRVPTEEELAEAVRHSGLSIVELHFRDHAGAPSGRPAPPR